MRTRAWRGAVGLVVAVGIVAGLSGCIPGTASHATVDRVFTIEDVQSLDLRLGDATLDDPYFSPVHAQIFAKREPPGVELLASGGCTPLLFVPRVILQDDVDSDDLVTHLGWLRMQAGPSTYDLVTVGVTARIFDAPADAAAFLGAVNGAARACSRGYSIDLFSCDECQTFDGVVGRSAVASVSAESDSRADGASGVLLTQREIEEWSGDYAVMYTETIYYLAYGNVVLALENASDAGQGVGYPALSEADRDSLVEQIIDQLGAVPETGLGTAT